MRIFITAALLVSTITADGPGGHHGGHHGAHHAVHGAGHVVSHATHGVPHHATHGAPHHATVNLGSHQQVGGVIHVSPVSQVHHPVQHHVASGHHTVQPVHGHFSVAAGQPQHHAASHGVHSAPTNTVPVAPVVTKVAAEPTIAELVSTNPKFSTLLAAVKAAGLADVLASEGPFTVFAPTNSAFDKVPTDALNALLADKEKLKSVILRHVVTGSKLQGKNIPPGTTTLKTAGGEEIDVTRDKFIQIKSSAGQAYVVLFDVLASNGVVHAVDTVF